MITSKSAPIWLVLITAAASIVALRARAGGDHVIFPENWAQSVMYTTVDRPVSPRPSTTGLANTAQYREH